MKILLILFLMTSVGWACEDPDVVPSVYCGKNSVEHYDGCNWSCDKYYYSREENAPVDMSMGFLQTLIGRIDKIESQLSDANKAINLLFKEDKLLQKQIEQLDYRVDVITESKQRP